MEYQSGTVYVGGLPPQVDSHTLSCYFEQYEAVLHCRVVQPKGQKTCTYALVSFGSTAAVNRVMSFQHSLMGYPLHIDHSVRCSPKDSLLRFCQGDTKSLFLFIQDIPKSINKTCLLRYFSQFGELSVARLSVVDHKCKDRLYLQYADINAMVNVKRTKHVIPGLCDEKITLVCKVGMFRTLKQVQILLDSEDLLSATLDLGSQVVAKIQSNSPATMSAPLSPRPNLESSTSERRKTVLNYSQASLNEAESNYRFNFISSHRPRRFTAIYDPFY